MPSTRKIVEILAPRTTLVAPQDPGAGDELLAAVRALIEMGVDPDLALEASLRKSIDRGASVAVGSPVDGIETDRGRESA